MQTEPVSGPTPPLRPGPYIYIACPWTPVGGGMYKVADYLIQAQAAVTPPHAARLAPLDTRGKDSSVWSLWVLLTALFKILRGRLSGQLVGVHVNMAERLSLLRKGVIVLTCRALGLPVVLHLHAAQLHHFYGRLPWLAQALTRGVFSLATSCVVLGTASRRFVIDELGVSAHRVEIVINGVPAPMALRRVPDPRPDAVLHVLFVGNLSARKGVSDLLLALADPRIKRLRLSVTLAGGGDVAAYQSQARALGLADRVHFTGWADQTQVAHLMAATDALVLPSYDEGLPLVILEALANGVAVVCTPVGEIPSVLTDGDNACFVKPGDTAGLAAALAQVLQQPALRERLERNGQALYAQHFSLMRFFTAVARIHQRNFGMSAASALPQATPNTPVTSAAPMASPAPATPSAVPLPPSLSRATTTAQWKHTQP